MLEVLQDMRKFVEEHMKWDDGSTVFYPMKQYDWTRDFPTDFLMPVERIKRGGQDREYLIVLLDDVATREKGISRLKLNSLVGASMSARVPLFPLLNLHSKFSQNSTNKQIDLFTGPKPDTIRHTRIVDYLRILSAPVRKPEQNMVHFCDLKENVLRIRKLGPKTTEIKPGYGVSNEGYPYTEVVIPRHFYLAKPPNIGQPYRLEEYNPHLVGKNYLAYAIKSED